VQINGKLRGTVAIPADASDADAIAAAKANGKIAAELEGKQIVKEIFVKGRLVNIVAR
jgi:leucyl-tRNA synthetase